MIHNEFCRELCSENLVFLFKIMQYKVRYQWYIMDGIDSDETFNKAFGYRILLPKQIFKLAKPINNREHDRYFKRDYRGKDGKRMSNFQVMPPPSEQLKQKKAKAKEKEKEKKIHKRDHGPRFSKHSNNNNNNNNENGSDNKPVLLNKKSSNKQQKFKNLTTKTNLESTINGDQITTRTPSDTSNQDNRLPVAIKKKHGKEKDTSNVQIIVESPKHDNDNNNETTNAAMTPNDDTSVMHIPEISADFSIVTNTEVDKDRDREREPDTPDFDNDSPQFTHIIASGANSVDTIHGGGDSTKSTPLTGAIREVGVLNGEKRSPMLIAGGRGNYVEIEHSQTVETVMSSHQALKKTTRKTGPIDTAATVTGVLGTESSRIKANGSGGDTMTTDEESDNIPTLSGAANIHSAPAMSLQSAGFNSNSNNSNNNNRYGGGGGYARNKDKDSFSIIAEVKTSDSENGNETSDNESKNTTENDDTDTQNETDDNDNDNNLRRVLSYDDATRSPNGNSIPDYGLIDGGRIASPRTFFRQFKRQSEILNKNVQMIQKNQEKLSENLNRWTITLTTTQGKTKKGDSSNNHNGIPGIALLSPIYADAELVATPATPATPASPTTPEINHLQSKGLTKTQSETVGLKGYNHIHNNTDMNKAKNGSSNITNNRQKHSKTQSGIELLKLNTKFNRNNSANSASKRRHSNELYKRSKSRGKRKHKSKHQRGDSRLDVRALNNEELQMFDFESLFSNDNNNKNNNNSEDVITTSQSMNTNMITSIPENEEESPLEKQSLQEAFGAKSQSVPAAHMNYNFKYTGSSSNNRNSFNANSTSTKDRIGNKDTYGLGLTSIAENEPETPDTPENDNDDQIAKLSTNSMERNLTVNNSTNKPRDSDASLSTPLVANVEVVQQTPSNGINGIASKTKTQDEKDEQNTPIEYLQNASEVLTIQETNSVPFIAGSGQHVGVVPSKVETQQQSTNIPPNKVNITTTANNSQTANANNIQSNTNNNSKSTSEVKDTNTTILMKLQLQEIEKADSENNKVENYENKAMNKKSEKENGKEKNENEKEKEKEMGKKKKKKRKKKKSKRKSKKSKKSKKLLAMKKHVIVGVNEQGEMQVNILSETDVSRDMLEDARDIYLRFVQPSCANEINIDFHSRRALQRCFEPSLFRTPQRLSRRLSKITNLAKKNANNNNEIVIDFDGDDTSGGDASSDFSKKHKNISKTHEEKLKQASGNGVKLDTSKDKKRFEGLTLIQKFRIFDYAAEQIEGVLRTDAFSRFRRSDEYFEFINDPEVRQRLEKIKIENLKYAPKKEKKKAPKLSATIAHKLEDMRKQKEKEKEREKQKQNDKNGKPK